ncbi:hypothetical protein PMAYCL1PPCAC_13186 [Pristionchus mayeri]|uniref:Uncharacterized protein n=1 Tax=Pristionchus mayeri TaxID=1317129 RepID=A0AAN4ZLI6_9BILA|nr:hypothetical protein PMAYCL1PPCAC_13186 [Pristionchus mayeri]
MSSFEELAKEEISRNARIASSVACALGPSISGLDWSTVSTVSGIIESLWVDDEALDRKITDAKEELALMRAAATISDFKEIATVHFVEAFLGLVGVVRNGGFTMSGGRSLNGEHLDTNGLFDTFITPKLEADLGDDEDNTGGESNEHSPENSSNDAADEDEKPMPGYSMSVLSGSGIDLSGLFGSSSPPPLTNGINGQHRPAKRTTSHASSSTPAKTEPPKKRKSHHKAMGGVAGKDAVEIPACAMRGGPLLPNGKRQWKCLMKNCSVSYDNLGGLGWHISAKHWSEGEFVACCLNCDKRLSCGRACSHAKKPGCTTANFAYWFDDVLDEKQKKQLCALEKNILGECPFDYCESKIESLQNLYDHGRVTHKKTGRLVFVCTGCQISMCKPSQLLKHSVRECGGARVVTKILSQVDGEDNVTMDED